eukprot:1841941-Pleurochrysis_carterae.AAC.2
MKPSTARAKASHTSNESPRSSVGEAARMPCAASVDDREKSRNARMLAASRTKSVLANEGAQRQVRRRVAARNRRYGR